MTISEQPTISEQLCGFARDLAFEAIPADVVQGAKLQILDALGLAIVVSTLPYGRVVQEGVAAMGKGDEASIIGFGGRTTTALAALINGAMADALDYDDTHNETHLHPGAHVVPLALAVSEATGADGRAALAATVLGTELGCRLAVAAPGQFSKIGMHTSSAVGYVATTIMAGRLYGLGLQQMVWSVGTAASQTGGILECYTDGTWTQGLHPGWMGHAAITAALLSRAGFTGPPTAIEGRMGLFRTHIQDRSFEPDFARTVRNLGQDWESRHISFKPYPTGCVIHPYLDAVLGLQREHGFRADEVAHVRLPMSHHWVNVVCEPVAEKRRPKTEVAARISLQYAVAEALVRERLDLDSMGDEDIRDPVILDLADRVDYVLDPDPPPRRNFKGWAEIRLKDGRLLERIEHPWTRGNADDPATPDMVRAKFRQNAGRALAAGRVEAIVDAVDHLEKELDLRRLMGLCGRG